MLNNALNIWKEIIDFLNKYFIEPIIYRKGEYNIYNTLTYSVTALLSLILLYRFLKEKIDFNLNFFLSLTPFIFLGSSLRVLDDASLVKTWLFVTPMIYILVFLIWFISLYFFWLKLDKLNLHVAFGFSLLLYPVYFLKQLNPHHLGLILYVSLLTLLFIVLFSVPRLLYRKVLLNPSEWLTLFSQTYDGFITFLGVTFYGYLEEHVLPRFIFNYLPTSTFIFLKAAVTLAVIYFLREYGKQGKFLLAAIFVLGLATGTRNFLRILFAV